jgi:phosphoglycolate phosphatase-like HAD superfamily hydrolase
MHICFFDIDGTLVDTGGAGQAAMQAAMALAFEVPPTSNGVSFAGRTDRAIVRDMFQLHEIADTAENWDRFCEVFVELLPDHLRRRDGHVLLGVAQLLDTLSSRENVILGLLTGNLRHGARLKLQHYGLYQHFSGEAAELGAFGDHHHQRDDVARDALASAAQFVQDEIDVDRVWVIGDTPRDVQCARAIGARVIAVATGVHGYQDLAVTNPDLLLDDLSDFSALVALLET